MKVNFKLPGKTAPVTKPPAAPPVSTRVVDGEVQLSKRRLADLAKIQNVEAREQLRQVWIDEALAAAEKNTFWSDRRNNMTIVVNPAKPERVNPKTGKHEKAIEAGRFLYLSGTGTRASAVFTKKKALEFLERIQEFADAVASMPDFDTEATDDSGEQA